jgi:hemoglobin-like flavoprotein
MLNAALLRQNFELVVDRCPKIGHRFYEVFFARYPQVRAMFNQSAEGQERQEKMLTEALVAVIDHLDDAPWLQENLFTLGARHVGYGVREEMYGWVGECLLATLAEASGDAWTPETLSTWSDAFTAIKDLMLQGARSAPAALEAQAASAAAVVAPVRP